MDALLAEFIGIYIGDGCLTVRVEKHSHEFKIVGNPKTQDSYIKNYVSALASNAAGRPVKARRMDSGRTIGVYFCSKTLAQQFFLLGLPGGPKAERIRIPEIIISGKATRRACIRGIFDTDGCFTLKKRGRVTPYYPTITFSMKNRAVMGQIGAALEAEGIPHSISFDLSSFDRRNGKSYSKHQVSIYGMENVCRWFGIFGSSNPETLSRYGAFLRTRRQARGVEASPHFFLRSKNSISDPQAWHLNCVSLASSKATNFSGAQLRQK